MRRIEPRGVARVATRWRAWRVAWPLAAILALALGACATSAGASAADILQRAGAKFQATQSFHFALSAAHLGANDPLPITAATGDVQRPDKLKANATANIAGFAVQTQLVIIGSDEWLSNPLTGAFEKTSGYDSLLAIFDAQQGVGAILAHLTRPSIPVSSSSAGGACWKITGTVSASDLAAVVGGGDTTVRAVPVTVCVGKSDDQLYSATLTGQVLASDTAQTTRTFVLSAFDKPVTITAPQ
ncbi:MAG TPA: LppX_LprAFG lipoprotein [Ktedonobacterales bacterium]|nr:LppX_LprAFG lipoprotein [Ktedonobacterales bacterium]